MKTKILNLVMMLGFVILSTMSFAQSGSGYDYVVVPGGDVTLSSGDYGTDVVIGVPNGGEITMHAPSGSTGQQWTGECGAVTNPDLATCGAGNYALATDQGAITIDLVWYVELDQPGEDFFEIQAADTTITISSNFMAAQWGEVGQSGNVNFSMGPLVPGKQYWVNTIDDANNFTYDTCTISQPVVNTYTATFTVTDGTNPISGALVSVTGQGTANTDGSGQCTFTDLADGTYDYTVTKSGYDMYNSSFTISGGNATVDVEMTETTAPVYVVNFHVQASSKNIVGATVTLTGYGDQDTDGSGNCSFTDIPDGTYAYSVTATGYQDVSGSVIVSGGDVTEYVYMDPLAVGDITEIEMTVYPNPSTDYLTINYAQDVRWELYSINGQIVMSGERKQLDISFLNNGYYMLRVNTDEGSVVKRILKQ